MGLSQAAEMETGKFGGVWLWRLFKIPLWLRGMQKSFTFYPGFSIHGVKQFAGHQPGFSLAAWEAIWPARCKQDCSQVSCYGNGRYKGIDPSERGGLKCGSAGEVCVDFILKAQGVICSVHPLSAAKFTKEVELSLSNLVHESRRRFPALQTFVPTCPLTTVWLCALMLMGIRAVHATIITTLSPVQVNY